MAVLEGQQVPVALGKGKRWRTGNRHRSGYWRRRIPGRHPLINRSLEGGQPVEDGL
jgi:hypothetical protein